MMAAISFETSAAVYQLTQRHISEELNLQQRRCDKLQISHYRLCLCLRAIDTVVFQLVRLSTWICKLHDTSCLL
jgi:hypothetical protein